jgi:hypothetical protein
MVGFELIGGSPAFYDIWQGYYIPPLISARSITAGGQEKFWKVFPNDTVFHQSIDPASPYGEEKDGKHFVN